MLGAWDTSITSSKTSTMLNICWKATDMRIDLRGCGGSQPASVSNVSTAARLQGREPWRLFQVLMFQKVKEKGVFTKVNCHCRAACY